ncbi:MAG: C40 family peptidase [Polyangiaceae bacterium]
MRFAESQVGKPYCWGGTGPSCFDCSGFVQTAYNYVGVRVPRTSEAQAKALPAISPYALQPGDVLYWPGHVAIYVGGGDVIDALGKKYGVVRRKPREAPERILRP